MKTQLFFIVVIMITILSCEKKVQTTVVSGIVLDAGSKQPIDSVLVTLLDGVSTAGEIIPGQTTSGKKNVAYSNKEGKFRVEITGEYSPFITLSKPRYGAPHGGLINSVKWGVANSMVYEMVAPSHFCGKFHNVGEPVQELKIAIIGPYDLKDTSQAMSGENVEGWQLVFRTNKSTYDICKENLIFYTGVGNSFQRYQLRVKRNNSWEKRLDSVYIKGFETYTDTINF
jgi:hypothetical protein